ncbi:hypothetical protein AYO40_01225 [Planctomycetaceae bacterium SCGC AG-212-D15]|nr:hypothetical protein AYO40_01225 [Planctomycetaceae bacterium SCGC AG-212-D15]
MAPLSRTIVGRLVQRLLGVRTISFEQYCGLYLNVERQRARRAWEVVNGNNISRSDDDLEYAWMEALSESPEEADERAFQENAERQERRAMAKIIGSIFDV